MDVLISEVLQDFMLQHTLQKSNNYFALGFFFFFSCGKKTRIKFVLSAVDLSTKVEKFLLPAQKLSENGPMAVIGLQRKKTT